MCSVQSSATGVRRSWERIYCHNNRYCCRMPYVFPFRRLALVRLSRTSIICQTIAITNQRATRSPARRSVPLQICNKSPTRLRCPNEPFRLIDGMHFTATHPKFVSVAATRDEQAQPFGWMGKISICLGRTENRGNSEVQTSRLC